MMKDKNGFTLVEILAVVVVLGLIIIIAIPTVTNILSGAKKTLSEYDLEQLLDASKFYIADIDNSKASIKINDVEYQGYNFKKYMNEQGTILITAYDLSKNNYYNPGCDYDKNDNKTCKVNKDCTIEINMEFDIENTYLVTKNINATLGSNCE